MRNPRRISVTLGIFLIGLSSVPILAQEKVAEGDYVVQSGSDEGSPETKTATHWVLRDKEGRGYHLTSEIAGQPKGLRVVQVEDLNSNLVPTAIGYELYRNDENAPSITVDCQFSGAAITCGGKFKKERVPSSSPFQVSGPVWLWMEGLFALDMPWLFDGAVNMAHLSESDSAKVPTVSVLGGTAVLIGDAVNVAKLREVQGPNQKLTVIAPDRPIQWRVYSDEESLLKLADTEPAELNGIKITVRHYTLLPSNGKEMGVWASESGILTKMSVDEGFFVLTNYKQYKKLIPQLPVDLENNLRRP